MPSFLQLVRTGATYEHWSRFIAMSLCFSVAIILVTTRACDYILGLLEDRLDYLHVRDAGGSYESVMQAAAAAR